MTPTSMPQDAPAVQAPEPVDRRRIREILAEHGRGALIAVLQDVQDEYGYLPEQALRAVADEADRPLVDVYGIATFYHCFSLKPRGRHVISACLGTACHVRGASQIVQEFQRQLGIEVGETTPDREFTLETVRCLGACALGPVVVVDGHYFCNVRKVGVADIVEAARCGLEGARPEDDERAFPLEVNCPRCNHGLMDPETRIDGLPSIRLTVGYRGAFYPVNLSSLYGSFESACGKEIPPGAVCEFSCPHCQGSLGGPSRCSQCRAPMIPMIVRGGGTVQVCTRRGCREHRLDLDGVNA